jgi:hypothetical protein
VAKKKDLGGGPYVSVATFCDRPTKMDGVLSLGRVIDTVTVQGQGRQAPAEFPSGQILGVTFAVVIKAGEATGSRDLKVSIVHPNGSVQPEFEQSVDLNGGPAGGATLVIPLAIPLSDSGIYWANVFVNETPMARAPLQINYKVRRRSVR